MKKGKKIRFQTINSDQKETFDSKIELLVYFLLEASPKIGTIVHHPQGQYGCDFVVETSDNRAFEVEATTLNSDGTVGARDDEETADDYFARKMASCSHPVMMVFGSVLELAHPSRVEHHKMTEHGGAFPTLPFYVWFYDPGTGETMKGCIGQYLGIRRPVAKAAAFAVLNEQYKACPSWRQMKRRITG